VRKAVAALLAAVASVPLAAAVAPTAAAAPAPVCRAGQVERLAVPSAAMGTDIEVIVQWARSCGPAALYMLGGLQADPGHNGWNEPEVLGAFAGDDVTLVLPTGGYASFYADWKQNPVTVKGESFQYMWDTFLSRELPAYLAGADVSPTGNAIIGYSMGATAALNLAEDHPEQFAWVGSLSGVLTTTAPGMRSGILAGMLFWAQADGTRMWGGLLDPEWLRNDPILGIGALRGTKVYISAGSGAADYYTDPVTDFDSAWDYFWGGVLEGVCRSHVGLWQAAALAAGVDAQYYLPAKGMHDWPMWEDQVPLVRPLILDALGLPGGSPTLPPDAAGPAVFGSTGSVGALGSLAGSSGGA
jgi:diacylglycerol O-acyltransferase/trehalose O-mycolyltransferase